MPVPPDDISPLERARRYDDVAAGYDQVSAPLLFEAPARELVTCVAPRRGTRVLDVGAGTGAVARAALDAVGPDGQVAAVDPSLRMLDGARRRGIVDLVAGALPDLPFADESFGVVLSAFVLTHLDDASAAIREMRRVLRRGGRIGLAAWGAGEDPYTRAWAEVAHEFIDPDVLANTVRRLMPGEDRFSISDGLPRLLAGEGFAGVRLETVVMWFALAIDEFIVAREVSATGRALRALLTPAQWARYQDRARSVLGERYRDGVRYERPVFFVVAERRD